MRNSVILWSVLVAIASASSSFAAIILPEDDVTYRTDTRYNNYVSPPNTYFGIFSKAGGTNDRGYMEFVVGDTAATSATLNLYNFWYKVTSPIYNVRIRAISEDEPGYVQWTDTAGPAPSGKSHELTWTLVGDFMPGSVGWYSLDITDLYNANLGERVTFSLRVTNSSTADAPIFEDKENSGGTGNAAHIQWVPEPASLLLLAVGSLLVARRRR